MFEIFNRKNRTIIFFIIACAFISSCASSIRSVKIEAPKEIENSFKVQSIASADVALVASVKVEPEVQVPLSSKSKKGAKVKAKEKKEPKKIVLIKKERLINQPFVVGEKTQLALVYLGLKAADLFIEVNPFVTVNDQKAYDIFAGMQTSSVMNLVYKADDYMNSYIDFYDFVPIKQIINLNESKQNLKQILSFDWKNKKSNLWRKRIDHKNNVTEINEQVELLPGSFDVISFIMYTRTLDFKIGSKYSFMVHENKRNWEVRLEAIREEIIHTDAFGKINTIVLQPKSFFNGEQYKKAEMLIWLTNDSRKIFVKFSGKAKIGTLYGYITKYYSPLDPSPVK